MDKFERLYNSLIHKPLNILGITVNREDDKVSITREGRTLWFNKKELAKEEYSLSESAKDAGYIDPVHVAKDGEVLDGIHRLLHDPQWSLKWHDEIDTEEKKIEFMYSVQFKRRSNKTELKNLINRDASILKATGRYKVGEYAEAIADRIGFTKQYVRKFLDEEFKLETKKREKKDLGNSVSQIEVKELSKYEMLDRLTQWVNADLDKTPIISDSERALLLVLKDGIIKWCGD